MTSPIHRLTRLTTSALAALAACAVLAPAALASPGLYFDYAIGPVDPDADALLTTARYETRRIGVGLALDTAVAKDKLFNYRMNLGYENTRERYQDVEFARFHQGSFENIFGFGVYRSKLMRVWLGPALRIAAGTADGDTGLGALVPGKVVNLTAGGGLAAGVNVHTGNFGSAAFTLGYQYSYQGRFITDAGVGIPSYLQGRDQRVNFNFSYFFRGKGDRFEKD